MAQWKKLLSRIATYQNKGHRGSREGREGSPIPGVELYDTIDGMDINIALELINEGHAKTTRKFGDLTHSHVLRLDGGSRATSFERLNDVSSASTTSSISSIISTINTSKKTLQESANKEPSSIATFKTDVPESATIDVIESIYEVNGINHLEEACKNDAVEKLTLKTINQNETEINSSNSRNDINPNRNGIHTHEYKEHSEEQIIVSTDS